MSRISIKTDFDDGEKLFAQELNNNFLVIQAGINANEENLQEVIDQAIEELDNELEEITADRGWDWNGGDRVTFFKGTASQVGNQEIRNGQLLYNTETGETALDDNDTRIVTGSGNVVTVADNAPTNPATKEWIKPTTIDGVDTAEEYFRDSNNNWKKILCAPSGDTLPIGAITQFSGSVAPTNWLMCNGQAVSRETYSELFAIIGTTYGEGDGSTTFNLPDYIGRVPIGLNAEDSDFDVLGELGGSKTHTLTNAEMGATEIQAERLGSYGINVYGRDTEKSPYSILPPYAVTNFIIKAKQSVGIVGTVTTNINDTNVNAVPNAGTVKNYVNNEIDSKHAYSSTERLIGTWFGKPLYSKTFTGTKVAGTNLTFDISDLSVETVFVDVSHTFMKSNAGNVYSMPSYMGPEIYRNIEIANNSIVVGSTTSSYCNGDVAITINYTKTTD